MHWIPKVAPELRRLRCSLMGLAFAFSVPAQTAGLRGVTRTNVTVLEIEGAVETARANTGIWIPSSVEQVLFPTDQMRTGERSRAVLRLTDLTLCRVGPLSHLRIPDPSGRKPGFRVLRGLFYFFHRDEPGNFEFETPVVSAVVRGTEFNIEVREDGTTTMKITEDMRKYAAEQGIAEESGAEVEDGSKVPRVPRKGQRALREGVKITASPR